MEKLTIIKTLKELTELNQYIKDQDFIAFDTETNGVEKESLIIGFSVCSDINLAYYVILYAWDTTQNKLMPLETLQGAKETLQLLVGKSLIMQNSPFDCFMVNNNFQIDLMPSVHTDTLMLGHLLNENRSNGLKERAVELYGEDAKAEQKAMKDSVVKNGGVLDKNNFELYKADADLIAYYGAKDAILTLKIFYNDVPQLYEEGLDKFFYEEETMPLLRGPTYDLNTTGLRVDPAKLQDLKATLEGDCAEAKHFILNEINPHVKEKYPGTNKKNQFNIDSGQQLAWLLFIQLNNEFKTLTKAGKELCKALNIRVPYSPSDKRFFIQTCVDNKDSIYEEARVDKKTGKKVSAKKVKDPWQYMAADKATLAKMASKYKWVEKLLEYKKNQKLLTTYVEGIQSKMRYNIIRPSFLQHGTTSGRYSSKAPNFQNLPREDKRIKSCIISRPSKVFVGADYSQLEPRVFASVSQDKTLMDCFKSGKDFYSVIGAPVFGIKNVSLYKDDANSFAKLHPKLRDASKVFGLATPYGRTATQQATSMGIEREAAQELINSYFELYPKVEIMMLESHEIVKKDGVVYNLYGRPRRIPEAKHIKKIYGNASHGELPYEARTLLNLAMNHRVQSSAASIMNRAAIAVWKTLQDLKEVDPKFGEVKIVMQIHDELIIEGPESLETEMIDILKSCMENTTVLPGVDLIAEPKSAKSLDLLK
jgi:DNA polymerase I-like protein with 3'-5' exonuclease and polymerase domains